MEIETLATLNALIEVVNPMSMDEENTYLGFAVKNSDVESLIADIEVLVREKYHGLTYGDLVDESKASIYLASRITA
ncbi:hypothetical protein [Ellagibacter isourolithinifaciens]|uniref:hypothetical protein n=1 Tax=Ellagibacter isourolithinifaciens TaxID=2137581 RepID=UPI0023F4471B|nr:hypothetical protein [Ellagibacter isourolithinifaciens]MDD5925524.1 hypothetical protein [Ellagibacter isourolithinifaciens]